MDYEQAFLAAIAAEPDGFHQLAYADWLDEQGQADRAEFIRIGHKLHEIRSERDAVSAAQEQLLCDREDALWERHREEWFPGLVRCTKDVSIERGFPWQATMPVRRFLDRGGHLLRIAPMIVEVCLELLGQNAVALARCRALLRVRRLWFRGPFRPSQAVAFFASPHLSNVRELTLNDPGGGPLGPRGGQALVSAKSLTGLEALHVSDHSLLDAGTAGIFQNPRFATLRELTLANNRLTDRTLVSIARAEFLGQLRELCLADNELSPSGVEILCRASHLAGLRHFELSRGSSDGSGALHIANATFAPALEVLHLGGCDLNDEAATRLFEADRLRRLDICCFSNNRPGERAFHALAQNRDFPALRLLDLNSCRLTPELAARLGAVGTLPGLRILWLSENRLTASGMRNLLAGPLLEGVQELDLSACRIGDEGAMALATSPSLSALRLLSLNRNGITDSGAKSLAASRTLSGLRSLSLDGNRISSNGAKCLLDSETLAGLHEFKIHDNRLSKAVKALVRSRFGEWSVFD